MPPADAPASRRPLWLRWAPLALLAAAMAGVWASGLAEALSFEELFRRRARLREMIAAHGLLAAFAFVALYAGFVALSLPGASLFTISAGFLFGTLQGGVVAAAGASIGAMIVFLIARSAFGAALANRAGPALVRMREGFAEGAASYLLFLRLTPVFPFVLVNLAAAALNAPFATFAWTTIVGILPATFAFASAGAGLDSVLAAQAATFDACVAAGRAACKLAFSASAILTPQLLAAFAALGCVALLPALVRRWRTSRASVASS